MKVIAIILLIAVGIYLYKRAQTNAQQDRQEQEKLVEDIIAEGDGSTKSTSEPQDSVQESMPTEEGVTVEPVTAAEADTTQAPPIQSTTETEFEPIAVIDESWASEKLNQAITQYNDATETEQKHTALLLVIAECYKHRKQDDYRQYGAKLSPRYRSLFTQLPSPKTEKGIGFMQLSTLLSDEGDFDDALQLCKVALDYGLSDGTATGFEGRITRIEKAKAKA